MNNTNSWKLYRDSQGYWWVYRPDWGVKLNTAFGTGAYAMGFIKHLADYYDYYKDQGRFKALDLREMIAIARSRNA